MMKSMLFVVALLLLWLSAGGAPAAGQELRFARLGDFRLESGEVKEILVKEKDCLRQGLFDRVPAHES